MSDPKQIGDEVWEFIFDYAKRHNRPELVEAFEEGASIWTDNPHPRAWWSARGSVKPGTFSPDRIAREVAMDAQYGNRKPR